MSEVIFDIASCTKFRSQGGVSFELVIDKLSLLSGNFIAVTGDSGCGKSTLLDLLALVSQPTECQLFSYYEKTNQYNIKELWQYSNENKLAEIRRKYLGYVLQTGGLLPFLTVRENIELPCKINNIKNKEIDLLAKRMEIDHLLNKKPQYISGGQRQRVAILRALSHNPSLILADEPTAAVDRRQADKIVANLKELANEHQTTIIMVTHDLRLVEPFADQYISFEVTEISDTKTRSKCLINE